jgi:hypothetical protein
MNMKLSSAVMAIGAIISGSAFAMISAMISVEI